MTKVQVLEKEIEKLPQKEYNQFRKWFLERDWEKWDDQINEDSKSNNLSFLIEEALEAKNKGMLTPI